MRTIVLSAALLLALPLAAQTVKPSPASEALDHASQDLASTQKSLDTAVNQARSTADANSKALQQKMGELQKALLDELKSDKKYKDQIAAFEAVQKQIQTQGQEAGMKFQQEAGPMQSSIAKDRALIEGLIPIVRKENDLPDNATYDQATQKWNVPTAKK